MKKEEMKKGMLDEAAVADKAAAAWKEAEKTVVAADTEKTEAPILRPYTLRRLKDADLFPMLKILKKIDISDCKDAFIQTASGEKTLEEIGIAVSIDIADVLIRNLDKAQEEIYGLWSDLSGLPVEEMKEMEFGTLPLMIMDTFSEARNTSFFKVLSRFLS